MLPHLFFISFDSFISIHHLHETTLLEMTASSLWANWTEIFILIIIFK